MSDFISLVLDSTKEYESPKRFYYWAALSAISAVLKDRVWTDMGKAYKLYPNIYVLLYGPSGIRKGPAVALAERVVRLVDNTRVINGRSSIEAIIKELGTFTTREKKEPIGDSCGFVVASELSSSIISNPYALDLMTNLYDRIYNEGEWKYKLKVGESHTLNKPTITWLSATNQSLLKDFLPEKNIYGGLIGRIFMISESKPNTINSLMYDPEVVPDYGKMLESILPLAKLSGPFEINSELRTEIDTWYKRFMLEIAPTLNDETGFVSRILDFIIKTMMLISSGRRGDKTLNADDFIEASDVIMPLIAPTKKAAQALKKEDAGAQEKRGLVLSYICNRPGYTCTRKDILKNLNLRLDHEDLDKVVNLMLQMQIIVLSNVGSDVVYTLNVNNPKTAKWLEQFKS
jgi:hypothetical protein